MHQNTQEWQRVNSTAPRTIIQGEFEVSNNPDLYFSTILGSCVAVCLFDPLIRAGGMNHILLPGEQKGGGGHSRYGVHLMELLINGLIRLGGQKASMQAKVFGGATISRANTGIGAKNGQFVRNFLLAEGIQCTSESLGGTQARKVHFIPTSGLARQMLIEPPKDLQEVEVRQPVRKPEPEDITLF